MNKDYQKEYYLNHTKPYLRTFEGHVKRMYQGMVKRIKLGKIPSKEIVSFAIFKKICKGNKQLEQLFQEWEVNNYSHHLTPTPDRINCEKGYILNNIQFLSRDDNVYKGVNFEQNLDRIKNGDYKSPNSTSKWCNRCKKFLNKNEFGKHKNRRNELQDYCKKCHREYNNLHRNKGRMAERSKAADCKSAPIGLTS